VSTVAKEDQVKAKAVLLSALDALFEIDLAAEAQPAQITLEVDGWEITATRSKETGYHIDLHYVQYRRGSC